MPSAYKRRGRPPKDYHGRYCVLDVGCPVKRYESDRPICCADCQQRSECEMVCQNAPERCNCWTFHLPTPAEPVLDGEKAG